MGNTAMATLPAFHLGTAGWQVPKTLLEASVAGAHLERYARLFNAVEINSTFYRPHLQRTFERWAAMVPNDFRFSVKMHREITHVQRLGDIRGAQIFLDMVNALGDKLGPVLIQLPPSLQWSDLLSEFLSALREIFAGPVVLEARHFSWAGPEAQQALRSNAISGVAADPPLITGETRPSGHPEPVYFRLHGSPRVYWSSYAESFLDVLSKQVVVLMRSGRSVWTIFDNTAAGAAAENALYLQHRVMKLLGEENALAG